MKRAASLLALTLLLLNASCGGGGGGGGSAATSASPQPVGQAKLGPIVHAAVSIFDLASLPAASDPIYTTTTRNSSDLDTAGTFSVPPAGIEKDQVYLVVIEGGQDIDADDDGVLDGEPTDCNGAIHGLLTGQQILAGDFKISVVTEVAYQFVKPRLDEGGVTADEVLSDLKTAAGMLLDEDLNQDGTIDEKDLAHFDIASHGQSLAADPSHYRALTDKIHDNSEITWADKLTIIYQSTGSLEAAANLPGITINGTKATIADIEGGPLEVDISDPADPQVVIDADSGVVVTGITPAPYYAPEQSDDDFSPGVTITMDVNSGEGSWNSSGGSTSSVDLGQYIADITNIDTAAVVGSIATSGEASKVAVSGQHAFVADGNAGLAIIDIADPADLSLAGSLDTPGKAVDVAVMNGYAYVADSDAGLEIIDVADPTNPVLVATFAPIQAATSVAVANGYAFFTDSAGGVRIVDVADPANPKGYGFFITQGTVSVPLADVAAADGYVYAVGPAPGLLVIDVADPANPALAATYQSMGHSVAVGSGYAFVEGDTGKALQIVDVSVPSSPQLAGSYAVGGIMDIAVKGESLFVVAPLSGLTVIDIADPAAPSLIDSFFTTTTASGIAADDRYVYLAESGSLQAIRYRQEAD